MRCKQHPRYVATRKPMKTTGYPDGCPICWAVWEHVKEDPKRRAATVSLELLPEEARLLLIALGRLAAQDPQVKKLYLLLAHGMGGSL